MKSIRVLLAVLVAIATARSQELSVPHVTQSQSNWCWAACAEMVIRCYGGSASQSDIAAYACGGKNVPNRLSGASGIMTNGKESVVAISVSDCIKHFAAVDCSFHGVLTEDEIKTQLKLGAPMILGYGYREILSGTTAKPFTTGHYVVLYSNSGGYKVRNPATSGATAEPREGVSFTYSALKRVVYRPADHHFLGNDVIGEWTETLSTTVAADVAILIDSTGSMSDQIDAAKGKASEIVGGLKKRFRDLRIALADYKDDDDSDYIVSPRLEFTDETDKLQAATGGIGASGGGDEQEAVYSAAKFALTDGLGSWRPNPAKRLIVVIADAGGKDPEPWSSGSSSAEVVKLANRKDMETRIYSLTPSDSFPFALKSVDASPKGQRVLRSVVKPPITVYQSAAQTFSLLAEKTGGVMLNQYWEQNVESAFESLANLIQDEPRTPRGIVSDTTPTFRRPVQGYGMLSRPRRELVQIQIERNGEWRPLVWGAFTASSETWTPRRRFPFGNLRWRLVSVIPRTALPPDDNGRRKIMPPQRLTEVEWTEFTIVKP